MLVIQLERRYELFVRKLILSHTWPNTAYALSIISQFMHNLLIPHLEAIHHILQYLKSTLGKGIFFSNHEHLVKAFTDADWAGSVDDRRTTSDYFTFIGHNLISWSSEKQVVARFCVEVEYSAVAHGVPELLWLKILQQDLGLFSDDPVKLYCDNKAAINSQSCPAWQNKTYWNKTFWNWLTLYEEKIK